MTKRRFKSVCRNGHRLTKQNIRVRADRNGAIECRACSVNGRKAFNERKPLWDTWYTMIRRCEDSTFKDWHLYGGRVPPVTVCDYWKSSYEAFAADMGMKPTKQHLLDRIDGKLNYTPDNCKWSTPKESARNTRTNRLITFNGETFTLAEWAERCNMKYIKLFMRLKRGWSIEKSITTP